MSTESSNKTKRRDAETAARVAKTVRITGICERSVYRVIKWQQKNELVMSTYMALQESEQQKEYELTQSLRLTGGIAPQRCQP